MDLTIAIAEDRVSDLLGLLSPSFKVKVRAGVDLKSFVCDQLGVQTAYFENRIQTLFLDSKPVDDVETATLNDGSVLALSAAMPGLVGATFRKGGRYSQLRKSISYQAEAGGTEKKQGWVTLKLFNLVLKELGPGFLERGVWVPGKQVKDFFEKMPPEIRRHIRSLTLEGETISPEALTEAVPGGAEVFIRVGVHH